MKVNERIAVFVIILSLGLFSSSLCQAQERGLSSALEEGIGQYKHENYEEALPLLKRAREEDPASTLAAYYLGLNYKQLQDYKKAAPHLRDAVTYSPKIKGALVELIDCLYHLGQLEEAKKWIHEAETEGIRPAQTAFLKGLVLLKEGNTSAAISSFEEAKNLDKSMTQACNYQIGIAHLKSKDFSYAQQAFKEVVVLDPSSNMAQYANEYVEAISRRREAMRPWRLSFGTAWQYDDNVVLRPDDASIAANIADEADSRQVYTTSVEYNHRFKEDLGIKGQYFFYYAKQNDLGFYDTISNTLVIQPSLYFKDSTLAFPVTYNHTTVNDSSYLSTPSTSAVYNFTVGPSNMGQVYLKYSNKNYLWTPSSPDEDRDSDELTAGLGWYIFFANKKGFLNLRYVLSREWTEGNNWEYLGNKINATVLMPLLDKLNLTLTASTYFQKFLNSHTVYNVRRKDNVYTASALLAYKLYKDYEAQLSYTFVKDDSNISVYSYKRHIYSIGVQCKF